MTYLGDAWGDDTWDQLKLAPLAHHVRFLGSGYYHGLATVAPILNVTSVNGQMILSWAGPFTLEQADRPYGPFIAINAGSPCTNAYWAPEGFFRLRSP